MRADPQAQVPIRANRCDCMIRQGIYVAERFPVLDVARRAGVGRPGARRWQLRYGEEENEGLLRDKSIPPLPRRSKTWSASICIYGAAFINGRAEPSRWTFHFTPACGRVVERCRRLLLDHNAPKNTTRRCQIQAPARNRDCPLTSKSTTNPRRPSSRRGRRSPSSTNSSMSPHIPPEPVPWHGPEKLIGFFGTCSNISGVC